MGEAQQGPLGGRGALVTGAARGLGRGIALALAEAGASLALCDREGDELSLVAEGLRSRGVAVIDACLDVRDAHAVRGFVESAVDGLGRLDVVVNNAGGTFMAGFVELSDKGMSALVDENFGSVANVIRAAAGLRRGVAKQELRSVEGKRTLRV